MAERAKYLFIRPPEQIQELSTAEGAENAEEFYGFQKEKIPAFHSPDNFLTL
jgi:hypothetical protein